ncbi:MAG: ferrous iron transport protein A [Planctomycetes bacterium]|nr:ferrous iron transport protein A [Planctomycetota bacterium]
MHHDVSPSHKCQEPNCCAAPGSPRPAVALWAMEEGAEGIVCETCLDAKDAAVLRAMGLRPRARVRVCRLGEPFIVEVMASVPGGCGCRIGLAKALAQRVMVGPA